MRFRRDPATEPSTAPRRRRWLFLGLILATALAAATTNLGRESSSRYAVLGDLPVKHRGRVKPLDSAAREEVEAIYGRGSLGVMGEDGVSSSVWAPVEAIVDWPARPEFWDGQGLILVEDPALRLRLRNGLQAVEPRRGGGRGTHFSPRELENLRIDCDGRTSTFPEWVDGLADRRDRSRDGPAGAASSLSPLEASAVDVGERLARYRAIRDHRSPVAPRLGLSLVPRPFGRRYLEFSADAFRKGMDPEQSLSPLEADAADALVGFLEGSQSTEWALPGEDALFDQKYLIWLGENSSWIADGALVEGDASEWSRAGFPVELVETFVESRRRLEEAERAAPGRPPETALADLAAAARDLGTSLGPSYVEPAATARETRLNRLAPFSLARTALAVGAVLLLSSLATAERSTTAFAGSSAVLHGLGAAALGFGAELIAYGLWVRFRIAHWGPVANLYDSVVFFATAAVLLGLAVELAWPRVHVALAAGLVGLAALVVAENGPFVERFLREVPPLLRSNRWLVGHVLPIMASYAAFGLAAAIGVLAVCCRLATTTPGASYRALAWPSPVGVALFAVGRFGLAPTGPLLSTPLADLRWEQFASATLVAAGGLLSLTGGFGLLGEFASRSPRGARLAGAALAALAAPTVLGIDLGTSWQEPTAAFSAFNPLLPGMMGGGLILLGLLADRAEKSSARVETLAGFVTCVILIGAPLLAVGALTGGFWARRAWGRFWGWDPKEVLALMTLMVYLAVVCGRLAGRLGGLGVSVASIAGFILVLTSWYGLNVVRPAGLHTYGVSPGGGHEAAAGVALALLSLVVATLWKTRLVNSQTQPSSDPSKLDIYNTETDGTLKV